VRRWLVVALVATALPAHADDRKAAERHFRMGEKAYKAQNFSAAAENFEAAYKELPLPEIAFSAAQAFRRQYRVEPRLEYARRAVELYRIYLAKVKTGGKVGVAADSIGEMQREADKLTAAGAKAAALISANQTRLGVSPQLATEKRELMTEIADLPDDNAVKITTLIDGKIVPPFEMIDVEPGPHKVHVEAEGYLPAETTERAVKGVSSVAEITMVPRPARVTITTERGAKVRVDGRPVGTAPLASLELPAGKHLITVVRAGREPSSREIDVTRGQALALDEPLETTGRRRAVPFVATGAGLLGAFAITSVVYAVVENSRATSQLAEIERGDQRPDAADRYASLIERRDRALTASYISGGAAIAVGVMAGALYWLDKPSEEHVRVTPAVTVGGGASVVIGGRF
jgi:hypothetical protein